MRDPEFRNWLPELQAHRGWWTEGLPQNSVAAIKMAFEKGFKISELDVRLTADGQVVIFHDDDIHKQLISALTYDELLKQIPINTLEELLAWLSRSADKSLKLNIELKSKNIFNFDLEKKVSDLIHNYNLSMQVMVSSFNPLALARFRFYSPRIYRALIQTYEDEDWNNWLIKKRFFNILARPHALHLRVDDFAAEKLRLVTKQVPVVLWTVNDLNIYLALKDQIFGIISDELTPTTTK